VNEDGRGPSIWDIYSHLEPSRTSGANGDIACDHYRRYEENLDLLARYGAKAYRFSLSWSRIIPLGGHDDPINEAGIAFYNQLIDGLVARGITLWATLYHWDLPQVLQDRYGGWLNSEESQKDFERYARLCYGRFGDRVKNRITLNESWNTVIHVSHLGISIKPPTIYHTYHAILAPMPDSSKRTEGLT
jgi:beta-glucosidase